MRTLPAKNCRNLKIKLIGALKRPIDLRALAPWWEQKVRKRWGGHGNLGITSHV